MVTKKGAIEELEIRLANIEETHSTIQFQLNDLVFDFNNVKRSIRELKEVSTHGH